MKKILIFSAFLMISLSLFSQENKKEEEEDLYFKLLSSLATDDSLIAEQLKGVQWLAQTRDSLFEILTKQSDPVNHPIYNQNDYKELVDNIKMVDSLLMLSIKSCIDHIDNHLKYFNDNLIIEGSNYWGEDISIPLLKVNREIFKKRGKLVVVMSIVRQDKFNEHQRN